MKNYSEKVKKYCRVKGENFVFIVPFGAFKKLINIALTALAKILMQKWFF